MGTIMVLKSGETENGISPVIAVLLILALTIVLTGIFAAAIISLGTADSTTPIAGIMISDNNGVITLTHFSGDTLPAGEYKILVNGVDQTQAFQAEGLDFSSGTTLTWDLGITHPLHQVSVVYAGTGGSVVIAEKQFYREGGGEVNAAFTAEVTEGKNATSQVKVGVSGTKPLPGMIADQADLWVVLDSVSGQATVEFTADESSADMVYSWNSGDGQTAVTRAAAFMYDAAGSYTVRLDILNTTSGDVGTRSMIVAVRNPGVTALAWVKRDNLVTGGIVARTTTGGLGLDRNSGGWALQYDNPGYFGIEFKVVLTDSFNKSFNHARSRVEMEPGTWYHVAGSVNDVGTTVSETLRIYVNGVYPTSTVYDTNPTGKRYLEPARSSIYLNPSFNISSYSEVPFPLSDAEVTSTYTAERDDPR